MWEKDSQTENIGGNIDLLTYKKPDKKLKDELNYVSTSFNS